MPRFDEAFGDPAKVAELQAAIRSELESLSEEAGPGRSPFSVLEYEVGGGWEEVEVSDPDQEVEILSKLLAATSPEFSSRLARLLCLLKGLQDGAYPELASVFASYYPLVFGTIDLDLGRLPLACSPDDQTVNVMSGSIGSLPFQFLPVPEEVAKEYCAGGKWDPPQVNLSFEKRVERLQSGRGW
jgi:hypothetical protein